MINRLGRHKIKLIASAAIAVAVILVWSFFLWQNEIFALVQYLTLWVKEEAKSFNQVPLILYPIAIFLLPIFWLPVSPIYLLAGGRPEPMWLILSVCFIGIIANVTVSFFIARKFSDIVCPWLEKRKVKIPKVRHDEHYDFVFLVRMIPGNPLAVQNYLLGVSGVDFKKYMIVSLPLQFLHMSGYIYFSEGILNGDVGNFMLGVSVLCVMAVIARIVQKRIKKRNGLPKTV